MVQLGNYYQLRLYIAEHQRNSDIHILPLMYANNVQGHLLKNAMSPNLILSWFTENSPLRKFYHILYRCTRDISPADTMNESTKPPKNYAAIFR